MERGLSRFGNTWKDGGVFEILGQEQLVDGATKRRQSGEAMEESATYVVRRGGG